MTTKSLQLFALTFLLFAIGANLTACRKKSKSGATSVPESEETVDNPQTTQQEQTVTATTQAPNDGGQLDQGSTSFSNLAFAFPEENAADLVRKQDVASGTYRLAEVNVQIGRQEDDGRATYALSYRHTLATPGSFSSDDTVNSAANQQVLDPNNLTEAIGFTANIPLSIEASGRFTRPMSFAQERDYGFNIGTDGRVAWGAAQTTGYYRMTSFVTGYYQNGLFLVPGLTNDRVGAVRYDGNTLTIYTSDRQRLDNRLVTTRYVFNRD